MKKERIIKPLYNPFPSSLLGGFGSSLITKYYLNAPKRKGNRFALQTTIKTIEQAQKSMPKKEKKK